VRTRLGIVIFLLAVVAAATAPLLGKARETATGSDFPGWPTRYEDRDLREMPLTPREIGFVRDFSGRVGRFHDGRREIIIRWVGAPTRRLHPAADCYRGSGYTVTPLPAGKDETGAVMSCFRAGLNGSRTRVCEVIRDQRGNTWPDVSAWYWNAVIGSARGPWWSYVVADPE
jgi:hypothetical protein